MATAGNEALFLALRFGCWGLKEPRVPADENKKQFVHKLQLQREAPPRLKRPFVMTAAQKHRWHVIESDIIPLKRSERGRGPASRNAFQILHIVEAWLQKKKPGIVNTLR